MVTVLVTMVLDTQETNTTIFLMKIVVKLTVMETVKVENGPTQFTKTTFMSQMTMSSLDALLMMKKEILDLDHRSKDLIRTLVEKLVKIIDFLPYKMVDIVLVTILMVHPVMCM